MLRWATTFAGWFVVDAAVLLATDRVRAARLMTCRDQARVLLVTEPLTNLAFIVAVAAWVGDEPPFVLVLIGYLGSRNFRTETWPRWTAHRHHDEDCTYGPRRHPFRGRKPRLVQFAPAAPLMSPA